LDIKNIFALVNGLEYNVGKGGSQKQQGLSPLDLRLSVYLLSIFSFDYKLIKRLNLFDEMDKDRYLSYKDMSIPKIIKIYK
jgi:hypothetical protein